MKLVELIDRDLLMRLQEFGQSRIGVAELRHFLAERYFPLPSSLNPFERIVIGELELRLAEMDRGDRGEEDLRDAARLFALVFNRLRVPVREIARLAPSRPAQDTSPLVTQPLPPFTPRSPS